MKKRPTGAAAADLSVSIDPHRLDDEWTSQPDKMKDAGDLLADANDRADRMKGKLEVTKAEVELRVRQKWNLFGFDKQPTEAAVAATVLTTKAYRIALSRYNKARHRAGLLKSLVAAVEQRKSALENLVKLFLADYYSDPKAPRGATRGDALKLASRRLFDGIDLPDKPKKKKRLRHGD